MSNWTINISESDQATEPADPDLAPQVIVSGNTVHVFWSARNAVYKLYYRRSLDGGKTWEPKVLLMEDTDQLLTTATTTRRMAVDGNNVHIFQNHYRGSWYGVLTYFRSTDNGASFETARDVATAAGAHHIRGIYVSASGGKVTAGYTNNRNWETADSVNVLVSSDNGQTFSDRHVASFGKTTTAPNLHDMLLVGDKIYLLYRNWHAFFGLQWGNLYLAASSDGGHTFTNTRISVPSDSAEGYHKTLSIQAHNYAPKIAAEGDNVSVVWSGIDDTGVTSLFYRRSTNSGVTFEAAQNLSKPVLPAGIVPVEGQNTIVAKGNYVYVVFVEAGTTRVLFRGSSDGGATFGPLKDLSREGYSHTSCCSVIVGGYPVIATDPADATGATLHVFYTEPRYVVSTDGGNSFSNPVMVGINFNSIFNLTSRYQMAVGSDGVIHFVSESRWSDTDIFYRRFSPIPPEPLAANRAMQFQTRYVKWEWDTFVGVLDNMQVKATADINFKSAMTVDAWVKFNRAPNSEGYFVFKADRRAGGWGSSYVLGQWRDGRVDAHIATTTAWYTLSAGSPVPNGVWTHVAMTYDAAGGANNFKIYVNGALAGAITATGELKTGEGSLFIGGGYRYRYSPADVNSIADVAVDDLRLWNRTLTQSEIWSYMSSGTTGRETGLNAYYNFNGTTKDITGKGNDGVLMYQEAYVDGRPVPVYNVTPSSGPNGTISPNGPQQINHGSTTRFTVTPNVGYAVSVGGTCGGTLVGNTYTTSAITGNCTVDATFALALMGDIDGDGRVNLADAVLALKVISGLSATIRSNYVTSGADVNGDGRVGIAEAIYVLQKLGGLRTGTYTASGTYTRNPTARVIDWNLTSSTFPCEGPGVGASSETGVTITSTTMTMGSKSDTWTRASGTAGDILGTWTFSNITTGNSYTFTFNANGTVSLVGVIVMCR